MLNLHEERTTRQNAAHMPPFPQSLAARSDAFSIDLQLYCLAIDGVPDKLLCFIVAVLDNTYFLPQKIYT